MITLHIILSIVSGIFIFITGFFVGIKTATDKMANAIFSALEDDKTMSYDDKIRIATNIRKHLNKQK